MSIEELSTRSREELLKAPIVELVSCTFDLDDADGWIYKPGDGYSTHVAILRQLDHFWRRMVEVKPRFRHLLVHQREYDALHTYFNTWSDFTILESGDIVTTTRITDNVIQSVICQVTGDAMRLSVSPRVKSGMFTILYAVENPPPKPDYVNVLRDITTIENLNQLIFEQYKKNFPLT